MGTRGLEVVAEVDTAAAAIDAAARWQPDVLVVDLAVTAGLGLGLLARLHDAAPEGSIVVLSAFPDLDVAAIEAGAVDVVAEDDLRGLGRCLDRAAEGDMPP